MSTYKFKLKNNNKKVIDVIVMKKTGEGNQTITSKRYDNFRDAFEDVINRHSSLNKEILEKGVLHNPEAVQKITYASETLSGQLDDIQLYYDGIVVVIGESLIENGP